VRYSDEKEVANRDFWDFGWEIAHAAVSRRPPISLDTMVARTEVYTHAAKSGCCPSFKGHFLCQPKGRPPRQRSEVEGAVAGAGRLAALDAKTNTELGLVVDFAACLNDMDATLRFDERARERAARYSDDKSGES
jgi:hypothetical protein